jgi:hypothetical protein
MDSPKNLAILQHINEFEHRRSVHQYEMRELDGLACRSILEKGERFKSSIVFVSTARTSGKPTRNVIAQIKFVHALNE